MRRITKTFLAFACTAAFFTLSGLSSALAGTTTGAAALGPVLITGQAVKENGNRLYVTNSTPNAVQPEIILNTSQETTRILDATTGLPVSYEDITDGETIYAYVGPAMTLSLPPQGSALIVLCKIPADYKVPEYLEVSSLEKNGQNSTLTAVGGQKYTISDNTQLLPYLTRNIVTVNDLTAGKNCLVWSESNTNRATKIVIFPESNMGTASGWNLEDGSWYYYNESGSLHHGWLLDNGKWYYLNAETGRMHTGFLSLDGKTYYLQPDGSMLTASKTFTPDSNGVLH